MPTEQLESPKLVRRFERSTDEPDDRTYDIIYTDRTTGKVVMRYDGVDPANTDPAYGAMPDDEALDRRGYDINEEVDISKCVVQVNPAEVQWLIEAKARTAQREKEEAESRDIFEFLGEEAATFNHSDHRKGEEEVLKPALEKRGFTHISFYMIEQDSFGPLVRGIVAIDPDGTRVRFQYG